MEEMNKVGIFVISFITIIIGIALLSTTADSVKLGTDGQYTITNESITTIEGTGVALANDWVQSITTVQLTNGTAITTTGTTNYSVQNLNSDTIATITYYADVGGTTGNYTGNATLITYEYDSNSYVRDGTSRTLIRLITIFFTLFILSIGIWAMYRMGLFDILGK